MITSSRWLTLALALFVALIPASASAERIRDLGQFEGLRANQLTGYGVVVGLPPAVCVEESVTVHRGRGQGRLARTAARNGLSICLRHLPHHDLRLSPVTHTSARLQSCSIRESVVVET